MEERPTQHEDSALRPGTLAVQDFWKLKILEKKISLLKTVTQEDGNMSLRKWNEKIIVRK